MSDSYKSMNKILQAFTTGIGVHLCGPARKTSVQEADAWLLGDRELNKCTGSI